MLDKLKSAISENNIKNAREILKNEFLEKNYSEETLNTAVELAETYNVFDVSDNEKMVKDVKEWDEHYLNKLKQALNINFSKDRFINAYYVSRKLRNEDNKTLNNIHLCSEYKDFYSGVKVGALLLGTVISTFAGTLLIRKLIKKK